MKKRNILYIVLAVFLTLSIAGRIYLPYWLKGYVNKTMDNIDGYSGSINDIEIDLYRGAYLIKGVVVNKKEGARKVPFIAIEMIDLSVQWKAILKGAVVAEVDLLKPVINFVGSSKPQNRQTGDEVDWTKPLKEVLPISINRLTITDGTLFYHDFESDPNIDISLNQLELLATNISNVENVGTGLPSSLTASASSIGNGQLNVVSKLNLLKKVPDVDLNLKFEEVSLPALNDFLRANVNVDAESGTFFLYAEIIVKDGKLNGYVKPILTNVSIVDSGEGEGNVLQDAWETIVGTVTEIFENKPKDQLATKVPLEGDLNDPDAAFFTTIWNIFRNAFVQGFTKNTDGTVNFVQEKK
ncbi:MAG: DUF748 domain-containing protein [Desulforhopalus sp.]